MDASSFIGNSKTDRLLLTIISLIVLFGITGIVVFVAFGESIVDMLIVIYGALGLNGLGGAVRNILVDGPIRQQAAAIEVAKEAQAVGMEAEVTVPGLRIWKPSNGKGESR